MNDDTLSKLQSANPELNILPVGDPAWKKYGRLLTRFDAGELIARAKALNPKTQGVAYEPSVPALEASCDFNRAMAREVYGGMPIQVGWCYGQNLEMNALEYHKGTEVNVCVTDAVLLVGDARDIEWGAKIRYDTAKVAAFYAAAGSVVEFHCWNLHYAPIHVSQGGDFMTVVYLPKTTNEPLPYAFDKVGENQLLFAINKWLIAHPDVEALANDGAYAGMVGNDIRVNPIA